MPNLGLGKAFLDLTPKAWARIEKKKLNWICSVKDIVKSRRQATDGEEILTNRINNKGLVSEIKNSQNKQTKHNYPIKGGEGQKIWTDNSPKKIDSK